MNPEIRYKYLFFITLFLLLVVMSFTTSYAANPSDTIYRIQIKENYDRPLSRIQVMQEFGLKTRVQEFYFEGYYYYTIYQYNDYYKTIESYFFVVNNYGISNAKIIKYVNGKRVSFNTDPVKLKQHYEDYKAGKIKAKPPKERPVQVQEKPLQIEHKPKQVEKKTQEIEEVIEDAPVDTVLKDTISVTMADKAVKETITLPVEEKVKISKKKKLKHVPFDRRFQTWLVRYIKKVQPAKIRNTLLQFAGIIFNNLLVMAVIFLIVYFVLMSLIFSISTLTIRFYKNRRKYKRIRLEEKYHNIIAAYLYQEKDANIVPPELFRQRSKFRKHIIIDVIVKLYISLEGDVSQKLRALYLNLRYNKVSLKKLRSRKWNVVAKGFRELANMDVEEAEKKIRKYLNHHNDELRSEAHIAIVRLNKKEPFEFLNHLNTYFTPWEMLNIHQVVKKYEIEVPRFVQWLDSSNDTVVIFSLKMVIIFKQIDAAEKLKSLLSHENELVREQAIKAVGELSQTDLAEILKLIYKDESSNNKKCIIKAMERITDEKHIEFLKDIVENEELFNLKLEAAKALHNMGPAGKIKLRLIREANKPDLDPIYNHVSDVRI
ncbi:HEAT repeat domain-containing protein [candidate division KSB1 bacterium]